MKGLYKLQGFRTCVGEGLLLDGVGKKDRNIFVYAPNIHLTPLGVCIEYIFFKYWLMPKL